MSNMGRPPKPLQEKILSGSRVRDDRDSDAQEANAAVELGMPPCPRWVKGEAKKHWDTLGPILVQAGLISVVDGDVFSMHCDNVARYADVVEKLNTIEDWLATTPNGFEVQDGYVQIRNKLQEQVMKTAAEFGLTPKARSSVKINKQQQLDLLGGDASQKDENDPYANYGIRSS